MSVGHQQPRRRIERRAHCPTCQRPVRLTEEELTEKRGFCAVCDARFDIRVDTLEDGPFRESDAVTLEPVLTPPLGCTERPIPDGVRLVLPRRVAEVAILAWWLTIFALVLAVLKPIIFLCFAALGVLVFVLGLGSGETVELGVDELRHRRKRVTTRVPLRDITSIAAEKQDRDWRVRLGRAGASDLVLAQGAAETVARWLAERIDRVRPRAA